AGVRHSYRRPSRRSRTTAVLGLLGRPENSCGDLRGERGEGGSVSGNGFFAASSLELVKAPEPRLPQCGECGLLKKCHSPKMPVDGEGRRKVLVLGESPGKNEDEQNRPFVGDAGETLRKAFARLDVDLRRDCWI